MNKTSIVVSIKNRGLKDKLYFDITRSSAERVQNLIDSKPEYMYTVFPPFTLMTDRDLVRAPKDKVIEFNERWEKQMAMMEQHPEFV